MPNDKYGKEKYEKWIEDRVNEGYFPSVEEAKDVMAYFAWVTYEWLKSTLKVSIPIRKDVLPLTVEKAIKYQDKIYDTESKNWKKIEEEIENTLNVFIRNTDIPEINTEPIYDIRPCKHRKNKMVVWKFSDEGYDIINALTVMEIEGDRFIIIGDEENIGRTWIINKYNLFMATGNPIEVYLKSDRNESGEQTYEIIQTPFIIYDPKEHKFQIFPRPTTSISTPSGLIYKGKIVNVDIGRVYMITKGCD